MRVCVLDYGFETCPYAHHPKQKIKTELIDHSKNQRQYNHFTRKTKNRFKASPFDCELNLMVVWRTFYQNRDQIKMFRICACFTIDSFARNRISNLLIGIDAVNDPTHIHIDNLHRNKIRFDFRLT